MKRYVIALCASLSLLSGVGIVLRQKADAAQTLSAPTKLKNEKEEALDTKNEIFGDSSNGVEDLKTIYKYIVFYRSNHNGQYPSDTSDVISEISNLPGVKDTETFKVALSAVLNPDSQYADDPEWRANPDSYSPYLITNRRPDGLFVGSPKLVGTKDVLAYTTLYVHETFTKTDIVHLGFYLVLWEDGSVEKVSCDQILYASTPAQKDAFFIVFPGQAGISPNSVTYEEYWTVLSDSPLPSLEKSSISEDNRGPEGLIQLSRRLSPIDVDSISREKLWQNFDTSQSQFTLSDVQSGATKLGLSTQVEKQTLAQLQKSGTPALLFLQDDGRIVTLTAIDDDRAVVIDRGLTQNVERNVLEKRYSGEALVPAKALTQNAAIVADDAVRELKLPSLEAEVPQQFVLRNTGTTPITFQLEYPLLGVTESKLSRDVIPPGETATLDLKVKWRSILKAPYQNVLVSIQTNDPIVPRLQLAILLTPLGGLAPAKTTDFKLATRHSADSTHNG